MYLSALGIMMLRNKQPPMAFAIQSDLGERKAGLQVGLLWEDSGLT